MSRDLGTLPKTQLHLHLAGAMRPATLHELAEAYGVPVPANDARKVKDWAQFQGLYDAARAVIRTPDDIAGVLTETAVGPVLSAGVPLKLASDDPLLFGVGPAGQYQIARNELALSDETQAGIARDGIEASAAPDEVKADLFAGVNRWLG